MLNPIRVSTLVSLAFPEIKHLMRHGSPLKIDTFPIGPAWEPRARPSYDRRAPSPQGHSANGPAARSGEAVSPPQ